MRVGSTGSTADLVVGVLTHLAGHPTEPWLYSLDGSTLAQYSLTTTSITQASSVNSTADAGIAISSNGDRLVSLSLSGELALYSIASNGTLQLVQTTALTNGPLSLATLPITRN